MARGATLAAGPPRRVAPAASADGLMCGLSYTLNEMLLWPGVRGLIGGGMIPTVFATAYSVSPGSTSAIVTPLIGLVATLAPTIGRTAAGYLTAQLSSRWLSFI